MDIGESKNKYSHDDQKNLLDDDGDDHHVEGASATATATSSSSSWRIRRSSGSTSNHLISRCKDNLADEESDEDLFTVPDVEARPPAGSAAAAAATVVNNNNTTTYTNKNINYNNPEVQSTAATGNINRHRGRNPVDKEYRRLKRLLRNRVSAQQARERKKVYVNDLESRAKELLEINTKLEEKISTLINENTMLRKVLMNTRPKVDESIEQKQ